MAISLHTFFIALLLGNPPAAGSPGLPKDLQDKIDAIVAGAYQAATAEFPCKIGTGGKRRMMSWQKVDRCLNNAAGEVDWEGISKQLEALRIEPTRVSLDEFIGAVETALATHALPYEKVFTVKDERAFLPLTNSILKFLPADSLHDLPVIDRTGSEVGRFSGVYSYERKGGLASANIYRLMLFQYTDKLGNVQSASEKLLLDSFGVPWKDTRTQLGFRLTSEKLDVKR